MLGFGRLRWPSETRLENAAFRVKIYKRFQWLSPRQRGDFHLQQRGKLPAGNLAGGLLFVARGQLLVNLRQMEIL